MDLKEHVNATWPDLLEGVLKEVPLLSKFNVENLRKLIPLLKTVPAEDFSMQYYMCGSVGCVLGHAALDTDFGDEFTGSYYTFGRDMFCSVAYEPALWDYLFSSSWAWSRNENTVDQAIQRIERVLDEFARTR